jgi:hypothetical protein
VNLGVAVPSAHFSGLESLDDFRVCTWISLHEFACRRARERTVWLCCASSFSRLMRGARSSVPCGESFLGLLVSAVGASPDEPTQVAICRWVQGFHLDAYIVWLCCASSFSRLMRGVRSSVPCGKSFLGLLVSAVDASPNEPTQVAIGRWVVWYCSGG